MLEYTDDCIFPSVAQPDNFYAAPTPGKAPGFHHISEQVELLEMKEI
jgi:hypothetical protein